MILNSDPRYSLAELPRHLGIFGLGKDQVPLQALPNPLQELNEDIRFLQAFGFDLTVLRNAQKQAELYQIPASQALIASGGVSERDYFRCVAFELGLDFVESVPPPAVAFRGVPSPENLTRMARLIFSGQAPSGSEKRPIYIAPECGQLSKIKALLASSPELANRVRVTTLTANKLCLEQCCAPDLLKNAKRKLSDNFPAFSARRTINIWQALILVFVIQFLLFVSYKNASGIVLGVHLFAVALYFGCIFLRLAAVFSFRKSSPIDRQNLRPAIQVLDEKLPSYSILVAMYQEANQVDALVDALLNLDWPRERLEIKLVCEQDDFETIEAVKEAQARVKCNIVSLVEVPQDSLRTKPKALNYALPLCSGQLLVIYDAEDRPHPFQLREAYNAFKNGPGNLGCVQAPLIIDNHGESWLSKMFAVEYSSLFDGLLPMLARARAPVPLGGTSNHFRRSVLEKVGAWDPHNVTEDADLGIRLKRSGFLIDIIHCPTYEEAPIEFSVWMKQRTRWFKGWYQTWLVHMRHPVALSRDLGLKGTLIFHMLITGMIISALAHPILIYFVIHRIYEFVQFGSIATSAQALFALDVVTITLGYCSFAALAWHTLPKRKLSGLRDGMWGLPLYWICLSFAAWRAVLHLMLKPHEWEKTPHGLSQRSIFETSRSQYFHKSQTMLPAA